MPLLCRLQLCLSARPSVAGVPSEAHLRAGHVNRDVHDLLHLQRLQVFGERFVPLAPEMNFKSIIFPPVDGAPEQSVFQQFPDF